jgi:replicative DNA helicase
MTNTENSYLIVLLEKGKSFKPLKEQFQMLEGFYNGIGYVFPQHNEQFIKRIVSSLNVKIMKMPFADGQTFESLRLSHKTSFFKEKLIENQSKLLKYRDDLEVDKLTEESIQSSPLPNPEKEAVLDLFHECERLKESIHWASGLEKALNINSSHTVQCVDELIEEHNAYLEKYRGKDFIGLKQVTLPSLDKLTLGIRGNILLAAAPNVGKTALTIQTALDVLKNNPNACVVYLSLEMPKLSIISRIRCHLAKMNWDTLVFGSVKEQKSDPLFKKEEFLRLKQADEILKKIGNRFCIITEKDCGEISTSSVLRIVEDLKKKTGCARTFIVLDYLQVWPIPDKVLRTIRSDNEADKWRIGQLKIISETLVDDPVLSISEARKPPDKTTSWGGELSDIMGSARNSYTPDMVLLYRSVLDKAGISMFFNKEAKPSDDQIEAIVQKYTEDCCDLQQVTLRKGRDGMKRGSFFLKFHYMKNTFEELTSRQIKKEFDEMLSKKPSSIKSYYETDSEEF